MSQVTVMPTASDRAASSGKPGHPSERRRSPPVPCGMQPKSTSGSTTRPAPARPSTTSLAVPSPPTATTMRSPPLAASRAMSVASPLRVVKTAWKSPCDARTARAIRSKWRPVRPPPLAGFTMRKGRREGSRRPVYRPGPAGSRRAASRAPPRAAKARTSRATGTPVGQSGSQPVQEAQAASASPDRASISGLFE